MHKPKHTKPLKDFEEDADVWKYQKHLENTGSETKLVIFQGYVYDITHYMGYHPGGYDMLAPMAGKNVDEPFSE